MNNNCTKPALFLVFFVGMICLSLAQSPPRQDIDLDLFIQDLFGDQDEDLRYDVIYENILQFYTKPLNLNKATREELENLFILSPQQITNLLKYRDENGAFLSEYELQAIEGFDAFTIEKIAPFVMVVDDGLYADNRNLWQKIRNDRNNYVIARYQRVLERQRGFAVDGSRTQSFLGTPEAMYYRARSYQKGDYSVGITAQKDIGEQIAWNPARSQYGLDFYSAHLTVYNRGRLKALNIGDYQMMMGQGLVMSAGFFVGKGAETVNTAKRSFNGIRPYTSALETGFLRGAAATISLGRFDITPFYSYRKLDGNVINNPNTENDIAAGDFTATASSILVSGFHRTQSELERKNTITENIAGNYVQYSTPDKSLKLGVYGLYQHFNPPIQRSVTIQNQFYFNGVDDYFLGADGSYVWKNFNFFGEFARNRVGGTAGMAGLVSSLHPMVDFAFLARNYTRDFYSFYGNAFGEASVNRNESGMYWGLKITPSRKFNVAAYYDRFHFPWLTTRSDAPINGHEYLLRANYKPTKKITVYGQWRHETKPINAIEYTTPIDYTEHTYRNNWLFNIDYKADQLVSTKSRVVFTEFNQKGRTPAYGFVIFQDLEFDIDKKWRISGRFALFDATDYNTRVYVYEKNVLWAFALPVYYGQGVRQYLMVQYKITRNLDIWARVARFDYRNVTRISSGVNEIAGNSKTDVTLQIKYDF